jgi:hypothetical protein
MLLISGSASRGEVHPWSDLDMLLVRPPTVEIPEEVYAWSVEDAAGIDDVTVLLHNEVFKPMRPGLVGRARSLSEVPRMVMPLPDPSIALDRVAFSIRMLPDEFAEERSRIDMFYKASGSYALGRFMGRVARRCTTAMTRLAVFHDGGSSTWLDDRSDEKALSELLGRLAEPAEVPFQRQAMLPKETASVLPDLLRLAGVEAECNDVAMCAEASRIFIGIEAWSESVAMMISEVDGPLAPTP